jgi:hypothetical protein
MEKKDQADFENRQANSNFETFEFLRPDHPKARSNVEMQTTTMIS